MKIIFDSIKDAGSLEKERIIFKVIEPTNIGCYLAAESKMFFGFLTKK